MIPDREKVIKGLEICTSKPCYCTDCPYRKDCALDSQELMEDALELLKEQEAVIPVKQIEQTEWTVKLLALCGNCRNHIISKWTFCPYCGKAVKWDGDGDAIPRNCDTSGDTIPRNCDTSFHLV